MGVTSARCQLWFRLAAAAALVVLPILLGSVLTNENQDASWEKTVIYIEVTVNFEEQIQAFGTPLSHLPQEMKNLESHFFFAFMQLMNLFKVKHQGTHSTMTAAIFSS